MKDIAAVAEVHPTTVSMALRGHHRIPERTRQRIKKIAKNMDYRPDPALASLMAYRLNSKNRKIQSELAWIDIAEDREYQRKNQIITEYHKGARARAAELGYNLERFEGHPDYMPAKRLNKILKERGIQGVLIAPLQTDYPDAVRTIDLHWNDFSCITFGYSLRAPEIHRVSSNFYQFVYTILRTGLERGFQRPGLVLNNYHNARIAYLWEAAYQTYGRRMFPGTLCPPFLFDLARVPEKEFRRWFQQHKPDMLIGHPKYGLPRLVQKLEYDVPEDVAIAYLGNNRDGAAGINRNDDYLGEIAVDRLVGMVQQYRKGVPNRPTVTLIDGIWEEGWTMPEESCAQAIADFNENPNLHFPRAMPGG